MNFMNKVNSFEDLTCWKKARELRKLLYQLAEELPRYEQFRLASQIRGVACSITANIAEGYGRYNYQEKIYFSRISRASALESKDHLYSCLDAGYIDECRFKAIYQKCTEVAIGINGYIGFIQREKDQKVKK